MKLDPESTKIFKCNIFEQKWIYLKKCSQKGYYAVVDRIRLAMFLLYYFIQCGFISSNDSKPAILYETNSLTSNDSTLLPKTLLLMKFKEKLKHRKVTQVAIALSCREE